MTRVEFLRVTNLIRLLSQPHRDIVWLDISMEKRLGVHVFNKFNLK